MVKVAIVQISPVFLDALKTWDKLESYIRQAHEEGASLITWGESLIPGYPLWLSQTNSSRFDNPDQKTAYKKYWEESIDFGSSQVLAGICDLAKDLDVMLMGGIAEKVGGSIYATLITVGGSGEVLGRHQKLKPTYEERLVWADGDGTGLNVHDLEGVPVGGLNCWENWMPLARAALHRQGEIIHVAAWPGSAGLTKDISRFIALEGRSWVISASGLYRPTDFGHLDKDSFPFKAHLEQNDGSWFNGGSLIVNPRGEVVAGPLIDKEGLLVAEVDVGLCIEERQNLDISGNYSRFDVFNEPRRREED